MNVEIGAKAAQFPEKKYKNGIFLAVWVRTLPKIQNGRHKQRSGQHTLARQKNIKKIQMNGKWSKYHVGWPEATMPSC
jgi:hypothetical protein